MNKFLNPLILILLLAVSLNAQIISERDLDYVNPEELVTLSETLKFSEAVDILSRVSEQLTGKRIVLSTNYNEPIGLSISAMPYVKALYTITQYHDLVYEERENVIVVGRENVTEQKSGPTADYASVDAKEVKISAIFFEANITEMKERGINWRYILQKSGLQLGTELISTAEDQQNDEENGGNDQGGDNMTASADYQVSLEYDFEIGNMAGSAASVFRFFESENLGEVIARPTITVRDRNEGRIQIGSDISIKQRDFAGNVIDKFISTGTIIQVTPFIYSEDGIDYALLKLELERSSGNPGAISTEIRKTSAKTEVLMLDGEETIIGGLFVNEESNERRGIPFLKDLPWWVLGIRYLTGYTQEIITKREIIILIKAEIVDSLRDRITRKLDVNKIKQKILEDESAIEKYKNMKLKINGE